MKKGMKQLGENLNHEDAIKKKTENYKRKQGSSTQQGVLSLLGDNFYKYINKLKQMLRKRTEYCKWML